MSFKDNVNLHVDKSAKLLNFSDDLLEHLKSIHSLIKVNVPYYGQHFVLVKPFLTRFSKTLILYLFCP